MLTDQQTMTALAALVATTTGWNDMTVEQYAVELSELDDPVALAAACRAIARGWTEARRPPLSLILDGYDRERTIRGPQQIDPARVHCDGTGWRPLADGYLTPCERCNPATAAVFASPDRLARWNDGAQLEHLDVGVERANGRLRYRNGYNPPRCHEADEDAERGRGPVNVLAAWKGYAEQCAADGRDAARAHFDKLIRSTP